MRGENMVIYDKDFDIDIDKVDAVLYEEEAESGTVIFAGIAIAMTPEQIKNVRRAFRHRTKSYAVKPDLSKFTDEEIHDVVYAK
jgi:hypothetical protein